MKILYVASARIPSRRAHALQTMQMCQALVRNGAEVSLLYAARTRPKDETLDADPFEFYGIDRCFDAVRIACIDLIDAFPQRIQYPFFLLQTVSFAIHVVMRRYRQDPDVVYVRDPYTLFFLHFLRPAWRHRLVFEAHGFPERRSSRRKLAGILRRLPALITVNEILRHRYIGLGISSRRVLVVPCGVDTEAYREPHDREDQPPAVVLDDNRPIVCYSGSLREEKGVRVVLESAALLPDCQILMVGGLERQVAAMASECRRRGLKNVTLAGFVPPSQVAGVLTKADVLVLPNSAVSKAASLYTSAMKFYDYAAAGKPIVASRLPAIEEMAIALPDQDLLVWVTSDDPSALAEGVRLALQRPVLNRAQRERLHAAIDWRARAAALLDFLSRGQGKNRV